MKSGFHTHLLFGSAFSKLRLGGANPSHLDEAGKKSIRRHGSLWITLAGGLLVFSGSMWAQNPCDLNGDGVVNSTDIQLAVNMTLGLSSCTANIDGPNVCDAVVVQRVVNAANGAACLIGNQHSVSLAWTASTSQGVVGYNVYRGTASGGPYTKVNSALLAVTNYSDTTVDSEQTYYYVTTAVNSSNVESAYSNQADVVIPYP